MNTKAKRTPKHCCLNCHFLVHPDFDDTARITAHEVKEPERKNIFENCFDGNIGEVRWACMKGVWHEDEYGPTEDEEAIKFIKQKFFLDRQDSCFFYKYCTGMPQGVAEELERRAADRREAEKDRALTRKAFWVAVIALGVSIFATAVNVVVTFINMIWSIWAHYHPPSP